MTTDPQVERLLDLSEKLLQKVYLSEWDAVFEYMNQRDNCLRTLSQSDWARNISDATKKKLVDLDGHIIDETQKASIRLKKQISEQSKSAYKLGHQHYLSYQNRCNLP